MTEDFFWIQSPEDCIQEDINSLLYLWKRDLRLHREIYAPNPIEVEKFENGELAPSTILVISSNLASKSFVGAVILRSLCEEWEIDNIYIAQSQRSQGNGRRLVQVVIDKAKTSNIKRVLLEVAEDNVAAKALYANAGFEKNGTRKNYYKSGADALLLSLTL